MKNLDVARECGAERVCHEDGGDELTEFTDAQLEKFAARIRIHEREHCALIAESGHRFAKDGDQIADSIRART